MHRSLRPAPLAAALATAFATAAPAHAATTGVVVGHGIYQHAKVCIDTNGNARCDAGEATAWSGADGGFSLPHAGAIVAEVGTDATLRDPATGVSTPVTRALVFRAAAGAGGVVGPLSTEVQAVADAKGKLSVARKDVAQRVGVTSAQVLEDPNAEADAGVQHLLFAESDGLLDRIANAVAEAGAKGDRLVALGDRLDLDPITNVVVIFAENRSFNNVFNAFPGANGVTRAPKGGFVAQKDRDGTVLQMLPPAWNGLTAAGQPVQVTQAMTTNVWKNQPFRIDSNHPAWGAPAIDQTVITRDLYHRFFENQMQIGDGSNDRFVAWADSGGLAMGWYDGTQTAMWKVAKEYALADNFFQGAFGGSYLNHQYLICACVPEYPNADTSPAHPSVAVLDKDADGNYTHNLTTSATSPASAMSGPPSFVLSGNLTPKNYFGDDTFRTVNTMQPAYQPSGNAPPQGGDGKYADPMIGTTLPAQTQTTIGDLLTAKSLSWKWYSGGWNAAMADRSKVYNPGAGNFQAHHQPFNYYAGFDPVADAQARADHLQDYDNLVADAAAGKLPAVSFYKPIGVNNEHPGYASLAQGDAHIAGVLQALKASPQWKNMLVIVTYDENGGQWDEVAPPKGDRVGPGTRIAAVFAGPYVKKHVVDHTQYDTASILRFITHRFSLPVLDGIAQRDAALASNGAATMGDLTNVLEFRHRNAGE